jgi:hypothetical protein
MGAMQGYSKEYHFGKCAKNLDKPEGFHKNVSLKSLKNLIIT